MTKSRLFILIAIFSILAPGMALAQVDDIILSPDITVTLGGTLVADENVATDNLSGGVALQNIGAIPANAEVSAYHRMGNGDQLFSLDITVELPGSVVATPQDVVRYDGGAFTIEFDGSDEGVPAGARVDAVSISGDGDLLLSFDTTLTLSALTVADEDLVEFNDPDYILFFDGSVAGVPTAADLDAAHWDNDNLFLYVSLDIGGTVDATVFSDEDLVRRAGPDWSMAYDGDSQHAAWLGGDLVAAFVQLLEELNFMDGFENL